MGAIEEKTLNAEETRPGTPGTLGAGRFVLGAWLWQQQPFLHTRPVRSGYPLAGIDFFRAIPRYGRVGSVGR